MTTLILTPTNWNTVRDELIKQYGMRPFLTAVAGRKTLGFSVREHSEWQITGYTGTHPHRSYVTTIRLDFVDSSTMLAFMLQYADYVSVPQRRIEKV